MRLNDLNSCFDNVAPSSEQKQRMLDKILERKTENGGTESLKHGTKRLAIAVALAAAFVLMATTALAVGLRWHERFIEYFGIGENQTDLLDGAVGSPGLSITENGVTVEVLQTLTDNQGVYVIFEVVVPKAVELTEDTSFYRLNLEAETELRTGDYGVAVSGGEILDVSGNKITAIADFFPSEPIKSGMLKLSLRDIGYYSQSFEDAVLDAKFITLVEGDWLLEWDFTYTDISKKVTPNQMVYDDDDAFVTEISISPVSICVSATGSMRSKLEGIFDTAEITVTFVDGGTIAYNFRDVNAGFSSVLDNPEDMIYRYRMYNRFDRIIDPDDVVSVTLCDVTIPIG